MNKIFEALRKDRKIVTESSSDKYTVVGNYENDIKDLETFDDFRAAMSYVINSQAESKLSEDDCYSLSIHRGGDTIFEIYYDGTTITDEYKCAREDELRIIEQFKNSGNMQAVSVSFDIEVNADLSEENIEQLIRNALKKAGIEVSGYMEIHSQD